MSRNSIYQRIQSLAQDCKCSLCSFLVQIILQILYLIYHIAGTTRSLWSERISNSHKHIKRNLSDSSSQPNLLIDNNNNWIHLLGDYNSQPVNLLKDNNNNWCHRISQLSKNSQQRVKATLKEATTQGANSRDNTHCSKDYCKTNTYFSLNYSNCLTKASLSQDTRHTTYQQEQHADQQSKET